MGNYINEIFSEYQNSGQKTVQWDGTNRAGKSVSPGLYFYRIRWFHETNKMILLKMAFNHRLINYQSDYFLNCF